MKLAELLAELKDLAEENNISEPYIVGGLPRDMLLGVPKKIKDIDITTGDEGSYALSIAALNKWPKAKYKDFDDGHASLSFKNIQVDFSNNFIIPNIEEELKKEGLDDPSSLEKEMFSRDFTINAFLQPLDLSKKPIDITGKSYNDLKNGVIRTPVRSELTIGHDPRRILRALKMAIKYDFSIDPELERAIFKNRLKVRNLPENQSKKIINQMLNIDTKGTLNLLSKYKILPLVPLSKLLTKEVAKHHMVQFLLEDII